MKQESTAQRLHRLAGWLLIWPLALTAQQEIGAPEPEPVVNAPTRYRVEVIVFAHAQRDPGEEHLDVVPARSRFTPVHRVPPKRFVDARMLQSLERQVDGPIEGAPPEGVLPPFSDDLLAIDQFDEPGFANVRVLDPSELQLGNALTRLERVDAYTPICHGGWEQNGLPERDAVDLEVSRLGCQSPVGSIRLHVSRFLHTRVDLAYRPSSALPADPALPPEPAFPLDPSPNPFDSGQPVRFGGPTLEPIYYLYEERRLFRDEINYLDHPAFGVLLLVTLAPEPTPDAPALPANGIAPSA